MCDPVATQPTSPRYTPKTFEKGRSEAANLPVAASLAKRTDPGCSFFFQKDLNKPEKRKVFARREIIANEPN
jgi:hypothetical protein